MYKTKWLFAVMLILLVSCKSKTALNYNNEFVDKENNLSTEIKLTESNVASYMTRQQFDSVGIAGEKMERIIETEIVKIEKEPVPSVKGGDEFKKSWLKYFGFMKSCYTTYKEFGYAKTEVERDEKLEVIRNYVAKAKDVVEELQSAQRRFADANDFKLEQKKF